MAMDFMISPSASPELARRGQLVARLAVTDDERELAYRLRYHVFYEEGHATADAQTVARQQDQDRFDAACDHLLLICPEAGLIGTCRLLRQQAAQSGPGFYTAGEFDVAPLLACHPHLRFMELGRSCIRASHRSGPAAQLLWQAIWTYFRQHKMDVMMGCASLEGADPASHALALGFLAAHCKAPADWDVKGKGHTVPLIPAPQVDLKSALRALPPLLKGYVRLGAHIGSEAVIDAQFGTTDVFVALPLTRIDPRYFAHFGAP
jgi:putative hemolysin